MKESDSVSVSVVIPVYKPQPTDNELISFTQCIRVLGRYPLILVSPHSLDISVYRDLCPTLQSQTFADRYFANIQGYNELMLSEEFYQAFSKLDYILIHQLDAFVFRDELANWCRLGYDYVGAPWLRDCDFTGWRDKLWFGIKQKMATLLDLKKDDGITPREIISLNAVGNGGLSLRRVSAMIRWQRVFRSKIDAYQQKQQYQYNEDIFWGIEVNRYWPFLRIPDYRKALHFAVEFYPQWAIEHYNEGRLPFGCHAWDIHGTAYWQSIFGQYGYQINTTNDRTGTP